jgi:signal transduction histidine kinase
MAGALFARGFSLFNPLPDSERARRFAIALATAVLAISLRWLLDPVLGHVAFYSTLYIAVAFCALICGWFPAVVTSLVGFCGIFYWFVDPRHSVFLLISQIHGIVGFFLVCAVLVALGHANRSKQLRLNEAVGALTREAEERQRAQAELSAAHDFLEQRVRERTHELSQILSRLEQEIRVREKTEDRLRNLSLRLMSVQDDERRRIARELHDTAGQTLAAIKMSVALLRDAPDRDFPQLIDDLNALADGALQEVRTASYLLHPPLLDEAGIASAARWFVHGFAQRSGIQVCCEMPDDLKRPSRHCELVLFRVLQESLTNVHRHSGASAVTVSLECEDEHLILEIIDNGKGISEERLHHLNDTSGSGVGLAGMRERVRELGGHFEIRSSSSGTRVAVQLPLLDKHSEPVETAAVS